MDDPGELVALRVTVSRGETDTRALLAPAGLQARVVLHAWRVDSPRPELVSRGPRAVFSSVRRYPQDPFAGVKTTSRAEFVYARLEATPSCADEASFLTTDGHLAEATAASLFFPKAGELFTPAVPPPPRGERDVTTRSSVKTVGHVHVAKEKRAAARGFPG